MALQAPHGTAKPSQVWCLFCSGCPDPHTHRRRAVPCSLGSVPPGVPASATLPIGPIISRFNGAFSSILFPKLGKCQQAPGTLEGLRGASSPSRSFIFRGFPSKRSLSILLDGSSHTSLLKFTTWRNVFRLPERLKRHKQEAHGGPEAVPPTPPTPPPAPAWSRHFPKRLAAASWRPPLF